MKNDQTTPQPHPPSQWLPPLQARRRYIPGLGNWLVGGFVSIVLFLAVFPVCGCGGIQVKGAQTKALAQAKQIGIALRLYAADNDGHFPQAGQPAMLGAKPKDANAAFAVLFPDYIQSELIFANKLSVYQTRPPDNKFDSPYTGHPDKTLEPGENVFGYVTGLNLDDDPALPLVVDGTDGTGHYVTDPKQRGGVWKGTKAIVIHVDDSGTLATLRGPDDARFIPRNPEAGSPESVRPARRSENLLDFSGFGPEVRLLDPAVDPR